MKKLSRVLLFLFCIPCTGYTATGDILFNCKFDGSGSTTAQVWTGCGGSADFGSLGLTSGSIVTGGHDGGKAISFYYPNTGSEVYDPMLTKPLNKPEITIEYWEKFDVNPNISGSWNVKGVRAWSGNGVDYIGGTMSLWGPQAINIQHLDGGATLTTTSAVTWVAGAPDYDKSSTGYCTNYPGGNTGGIPVTCVLGRYAAVKWAGYGTNWHKVRMYVKSPSNPAGNSRDGIVKMWMDDVLLMTVTGINGYSTINNTIGQVSFHPSDDFFGGASDKAPFRHLYDDITIYEGLVPPSGQAPKTLAAPSGIKVISK